MLTKEQTTNTIGSNVRTAPYADCTITRCSALLSPSQPHRDK